MIQVDANQNVQGLLFTNTDTTTFQNITGGVRTLTVGSAGLTINATAGTVAFTGTNAATRIQFTLNGSQTWTNNSSNALALTNQNLISTGGTGANNGAALTIAGTGDISIASAISQNGTITKNGSGQLTLSGANTFNGTVTLNAGKLVLGGNGALGNQTLTINDGTTIDVTTARLNNKNNAMNWNGNFTFGGCNTWDTGTGAVTMNASRTVTVNGAGAMTVGGAIGGAGLTLTKAGSGTLTLNATNTYGATTVSAGVLSIASTGALPGFGTSGCYTVSSGATLAIGNAVTDGNLATMLGTTNFAAGSNIGFDTIAGNRTYSANITNTSNGALGVTIFSPTNALTLSGNNTYTGGTTINAGTLVIGSAKALGATAGTFTINGGTLDTTANATLTMSNNNPITINGNFSYSGSAGTAAELNTGTGAVSLGTAAGTTRQLTVSAGQLTLGGNITDGTTANRITKAGGGTLRLNGNNTYTGGTVVSAGNIMAGSNNAFGTGNITFTGGSIELSSFTISNDLIFSSNLGSSNVLGGDMVLNGTISGTGTWGYNGFSNGSVAFGGNNSGWSGDITLAGAQIRLGHVNAAGTGKIIIGNVLGLQSMSSSVDLSGGAGVANTLEGNQGFAFYLDNSLKYSGVIKDNAGNSNPTASIRLNSGSTGTLYLTNNNTYTGFTNIQASVLEVTALGNGGEARNIGAATSAAANLVIGGNSTGGTLRYVGAGETTDRLFTIGSASTAYNILNGGGPAPVVNLAATVNSTIDSSGSGALVFGNTGSLLVGNALNTVFELTGSNTGNNTIAAVIGNTSAHAPIALANSTTASNTTGGGNRQIQVTDTTGIMVGDIITGTGITGSTTVGQILGPTRIVMVDGATLNQTANATLTFTNPDVSLNKTSVTKSGTGTWVLTGTNTYSGSTTVSAGTLVAAHNNALGTTAAGTSVAVGGTLAMTGGVSIGAETLSLTADTSASNSILTSIGGSNTWGGDITVDTGSGTGRTILNSEAGSNLLVAGNVNLSAGANDFVIRGDGNGEISGQITGAQRLFKSSLGAGTWTLSGDNSATFTGRTAIANGTLQVSSEANLGATPGSIVANQLSVGGGSTNGTLKTTATMAISANRGIALNAGGGTFNTDASTDLTVNSVISSTGNLTKSGAGSLILAGLNTYTGETFVNAGTLLINGSTSTSSVVTVNSSGTLGGNGIVGGDTTIAAGGNLSPGNSPGVLTFTGNLTLGGTTTMEITGVTTRGTDFDGIDVGVKLTYGGDLSFMFGPGALSNTLPIDLFGFASREPLSAFANVTSTGFYNGAWTPSGDTWTFTDGVQTLTFDQTTGDLGIAAVPEPTTWLLAALGLTTVVVFRRRRQD